MKKVELVTILLMVAALLASVVVQAESTKQAQPKEPRTDSEIESAPASLPQTCPLAGSLQGYPTVTDILDGFGGESESDNYRIPVNSGGQPSAIGISESDNYVVKAGYAHAPYVMHGDATGDGTIDVADVLHLINYLFLGTSAPCPTEAGDCNCDGVVDVADVLCIINYLFLGTSPPGC